MSDYRIEFFHPLTIVNRWEELLPHLERVIKVSNDEFTTESIKARAVSGNSVMIVIIDKDNKIEAVTTAEVVTYDSGLRSLLVPIIGGSHFFEWAPDWFEIVKALAVQLNCSELRGFAVRDGWMRILKSRGWHENHCVITYQLEAPK
jgi:hypothetical protein